MTVVQIPASALRLNSPVPFALRDAAGRLLVPRGGSVDSPDQLAQMVAQGVYVDQAESEQFRRRMTDRAASPAELPAELVPAPRRKRSDPIGDFNGLMLRTSALLHQANEAGFMARVQRIDDELLDWLDGDPDSLLAVLIHTCTGEHPQYSVSHALLVAAVCELAARFLVDWPAERRTSLRRAALTMNISVTELQNQLVLQDAPLSTKQREIIDAHPMRSAAIMRSFGVGDELWLRAVEHHHMAPAGPLEQLPVHQQLARLIQRTDIFVARLSPRRSRQALSASAAAKATYLDENKQADEAGSVIVRALGIYPPGSYVRLESGEIAMVLRRGRRANEPRVASIVNRSGTPMGVPAVRDTRVHGYEVVAGVAPHEVKVRVNLESLLRLG